MTVVTREAREPVRRAARGERVRGLSDQELLGAGGRKCRIACWAGQAAPGRVRGEDRAAGLDAPAAGDGARVIDPDGGQALPEAPDEGSIGFGAAPGRLAGSTNPEYSTTVRNPSRS